MFHVKPFAVPGLLLILVSRETMLELVSTPPVGISSAFLKIHRWAGIVTSGHIQAFLKFTAGPGLFHVKH
jgi:hypothetical protein